MLAWFFSLVAFVNSFIPQPTFREGIVGQPKNLNPLEITTNQPDRDLALFVHRGLMKYNEKGDLSPDLAQSYKVSDDHKQYTFSLHRRVYWHDGQPFNADDVIETLSQQQLQVLEIDKLDDYTVRLKLIKDPYAPLLDLLTQPLLPAAYKHSSPQGLFAVGLGDYRVARIKKSSKIDAVYLTLAWPWQKASSPFSRIIFTFYNNAFEAVTAARLGEIDAFGFSGEMETPQNFEKVSYPVGSRYYTLFFNLENEFLKERDFRLYLKSLVPLETIIKERLNGSVAAAYDPLEYTFANPKAATPAARTRLGLKKKLDLPLIITLPDSKSGVDENLKNLTALAEGIKDAWQKAGLKVEIKKVPLDAVFKDVVSKRDFQILVFGQEVERDPDVYTLWHSAQINLPGLNFTSFKSALADKSLEDGRQSFTREERRLFYERFLKVFRDETPAIFLYHPLYNYFIKKNIQGPNLQGFFKVSDRFMNFSDWRRL